MPSDYKAITAHNEQQLGKDTASRKTQVSIYSDSTHFVYEILQNADDYGATEVCFNLSENEIVIEHNGEPFTEKNVEAITYFGKSTSRDDLVKTGRFGVGFKSVFTFTAMPIVISNSEHFQIYGLYRIREYPYPDGFSRFRTRIVLPFNHESEQPDFVEKLMRREEAYTQISECLTTLNMNTLLFTQNIQEIRWEIDDHSSCYRREDEMENNVRFTTITNGKRENKYVVFSKTPKWKDQAYKAVEIAFAVDTLGQLSPIDNDSLYVLFRTEEKTGLKFILNGPYRTNPARETISKTDDFNLNLMKVTCELMKEALPYLRDRNLLTVEFLSILPNQEDTLQDFYTPLCDTIISEFRNEILTPMKQGGHAAASGLYRESRQLSGLIQDGDLARLLEKDRSLPLWVAEPKPMQNRDEKGQFAEDINAQRCNERISKFLSMLDVSKWTIEDLIDLLRTRTEIVMEWLKEKMDAWHQELYVLLGNYLSGTEDRYNFHQQRKNKLCRLHIVRCSDGIYRVGSECFFTADDSEHDNDLQLGAANLVEENQCHAQEESEHEEEFHYVAEGVYSSAGKDDQKQKARKFLEDIGVSNVGEAERVKAILKQRYTRGLIKPREADLERFIKLVEAYPSKAELFTSYPIFQIDKDMDDKGKWKTPKEIFLDSPYLDTGLATYYEAIEIDANHLRWALSPKYAQFNIDPKRLGKFAEAVGAQTKLQIFEHEIPDDHPQWDWLRSAPGDRLTGTSINEDYSICEFNVLYDNPSIDKAKLIWQTMHSLSERYLKARFRWNQSNDPREAHSNLVHCLKETEWVPQKDGDSICFVLPRTAWIEYLPDGFQYDTGQAWLDVVDFGKTTRERESQFIQRNESAKDFGFDSVDEAEKMATIANDLKAQGKLPEDLVRQIRREELLIINLSHAEEKRYEIRSRSIRPTRNSIDPKTPLRALYTTEMNNVECQMCRQGMPFKKRNSEKDYFEAVEALGTEYFPLEHVAQYLALCPECAAKYEEYVKGDKRVRKTLYKVLRDSDDPEVLLELSGFKIEIQFKKKHWQDLKTVLYYYENFYDKES